MKKMIPIGKKPRVSKMLIFLCAFSAVLAVVLSVVSILSYSRSAKEKNELQREASGLHAQYDRIVMENNLLKAELKQLQDIKKNVDSDAGSIHRNAQNLEDAAVFYQECEELKKQIAEMTVRRDELYAQFPEGYFDLDEE